jgi:hypothetical protein
VRNRPKTLISPRFKIEPMMNIELGTKMNLPPLRRARVIHLVVPVASCLRSVI